MTETKISQKSLKGPDRFQVVVMGWIAWAKQRQAIIAYLLSAVVLIAGGAFGWQYYQEKMTDARQDELGVIDVVFKNEADGAEKQRDKLRQELAKLDEPLVDAKAGEDAKKPVTIPAAKPAPNTDDPKHKEIQAKIKAIREDHSASLKQYQSYFEKYPQKPEGWMAALRIATIYLTDRKTAEARPLVDRVIVASKKSPLHQISARMISLALFEDGGEYDKALTEVQELDSVVNDELRTQLLLTKGRIQMLKNDKDGAKVTFGQLIEKFGTSPEAAKARSLRSLL